MPTKHVIHNLSTGRKDQSGFEDANFRVHIYTNHETLLKKDKIHVECTSESGGNYI